MLKSKTLDMGGINRTDFTSYFLKIGGKTEDQATFKGSYWEVVVGPEKPAKLGRFNINRVLITFHVEEDTFDDFMAKFNINFLRAGG